LSALLNFLVLYLYAFQGYCRFCSPACHFSLPHLYSPKFPHVPVEIGGSPFGYKERRCSAKLLSVQLVSKISNLCDHNPTTSQTEGRTTCHRKTALCTKVRCAVKRKTIYSNVTNSQHDVQNLELTNFVLKESRPRTHRGRRRRAGGMCLPSPPQKKKSGKIFFGQLLCKIRAFFGQKSCKIWAFC